MRSLPSRAASKPPLLLTIFALMIAMTAGEPAWGQSDDFSLRSYYTANGLLNRGLYEEAVAEYVAFLDTGPTGDQAATARYGLAVALSQLKRSAEARAQLDLIEVSTEFAFKFESILLRAQLMYSMSEFRDAGDIAANLVQTERNHPQAYMAAGLWVECLYRSGDHAASVEHAQHMLQDSFYADKDMDRVALFGGLSLSELGDDEGAAQLLRPVSGREDELGRTASLSLASMLFGLGQHDEAAALYRKLIASRSPTWSPQGLLGLSRIRRADGAFDKAISFLEELEEEYPSSAVSQESRLELGINLIESGQFAAGRQRLPRFTENDRTHLASRSDYWRAKSKLRENDPDGAAAALAAAVKTYPDSPIVPEMLYDLGVALVEIGDDERALEVFLVLRRTHGQHRLVNAARLAEATTLLSLGQLEQAMAAASRVDSSATEAPEAELVIAEVDALSGDHEEVVERLIRWIASTPNHQGSDRARYRLCMSLASLARLDEAERIWSELITTDAVPDRFQPGLVALGDASYRDENWARAAFWYDRALAADVASSTGARLKLGLTYARQGRHSEAVPLFLIAAENASNGDASTQAVFELGQSQLMLGNDNEAAVAFSTLLIDAPTSRFGVHAMRQLGGIAERTGSPEAAVDWYAQAAAQGGDTAQASRRDQSRTALAAGDYEVSKALAAAWDDHDLNVYAGIAAARSGDAQEAIPMLTSALGAGDLSVEVRSSAILEKAWCERHLGNPEDSMASLRKLLDQDRKDRYAVYAALEAASMELDADQIDEAASWLDYAGKIVESHPEITESSMLAQLDIRNAQHATATGEHQRVIERLGTFDERHSESSLGVTAAILLGDALIATKQPELAAESFERAVGEADGDVLATAMLRLGHAFGQAKRWAKSREVFERFLDSYSKTEFAFEAEFGRAWALEHEGEHARAREGYTRVVESHNGETAARAQFQIGECLFAEGRHDDAVRELLRVDILYDYPEWSAAAMYEAGRAFEQLRKFGEARQQYREIGQRFGESSWAVLAADRLAALSSAD